MGGSLGWKVFFLFLLFEQPCQAVSHTSTSTAQLATGAGWEGGMGVAQNKAMENIKKYVIVLLATGVVAGALMYFLVTGHYMYAVGGMPQEPPYQDILDNENVWKKSGLIIPVTLVMGFLLGNEIVDEMKLLATFTMCSTPSHLREHKSFLRLQHHIFTGIEDTINEYAEIRDEIHVIFFMEPESEKLRVYKYDNVSSRMEGGMLGYMPDPFLSKLEATYDIDDNEIIFAVNCLPFTDQMMDLDANELVHGQYAQDPRVSEETRRRAKPGTSITVSSMSLKWPHVFKEVVDGDGVQCLEAALEHTDHPRLEHSNAEGRNYLMAIDSAPAPLPDEVEFPKRENTMGVRERTRATAYRYLLLFMVVFMYILALYAPVRIYNGGGAESSAAYDIYVYSAPMVTIIAMLFVLTLIARIVVGVIAYISPTNTVTVGITRRFYVLFSMALANLIPAITYKMVFVYRSMLDHYRLQMVSRSAIWMEHILSMLFFGNAIAEFMNAKEGKPYLPQILTPKLAELVLGLTGAINGIMSFQDMVNQAFPIEDEIGCDLQQMYNVVVGCGSFQNASEPVITYQMTTPVMNATSWCGRFSEKGLCTWEQLGAHRFMAELGSSIFLTCTVADGRSLTMGTTCIDEGIAGSVFSVVEDEQLLDNLCPASATKRSLSALQATDGVSSSMSSSTSQGAALQATDKVSTVVDIAGELKTLKSQLDAANMRVASLEIMLEQKAQEPPQAQAQVQPKPQQPQALPPPPQQHQH